MPAFKHAAAQKNVVSAMLGVLPLQSSGIYKNTIRLLGE
jgi:hypothetical protein